MKNILKKTLAVFAAALMIFSFSINTFAKNWHFYRGSNAYGTNIYMYCVKLKNEKGSEKITIVNTGNTPFDIL